MILNREDTCLTQWQWYGDVQVRLIRVVFLNDMRAKIRVKGSIYSNTPLLMYVDGSLNKV
jgi:hypothetical protein